MTASRRRTRTDATALTHPPLKPGDACSGFRVQRVTDLPDLACVCIEAIHEVTGAKLLHLHAAHDEENLLAVAFRTPPPDDTGVAHILEHSVLAGSKNYPVKDPFVELLKMSMATFINAMTYPDKTVYPVASNVEKDFFNLAQVYCDAVLHPNITPMTLKQEGWHYAFAVPGDMASPLVIKGIVYNEMKGAYSDLDALIDRRNGQCLFPDTPYGLDSGGDPEAIPSLTYEAFKSFFQRYYHPVNARIFLYGNIPTQRHLEFLDARLSQAPDAPLPLADSSIPGQPRWQAPVTETHAYPIDPSEDPDGKCAVTVNWLVGNVAEPVVDLAFEVVDRLLLGSAGAPLRRALIESQLGTDLTSSGYGNGLQETTFHVGLKGVRRENRRKVVDLIFDTLGNVAETGVSTTQVETAFHQLQYAHREIQTLYPLRLMGWVYNSWLYDCDPLIYLRTAHYLEELEDRYRQNPDVFCQLLRDRLIRNPHRATLAFEPDPDLERRRCEQEQRRLADIKAAMSRDEQEAICREDAELERFQSTPNPPAAIDTLPQLQIQDLPETPSVIPTEVDAVGPGIPFVQCGLPTNGINYLLLGFNLKNLPPGLIPYVPVFARILTRMGAAGQSYAQTAERIAGCTGGLAASIFTGVDALDPSRPLVYLSINAKSLDQTYESALRLIRDLLFDLDLADVSHLRDLMKQARERHLSGIIPGGHRFAAHHAGRTLSPLAALEYLWSGVPQTALLCALAERCDGLEDLRRHLEQLRQFLLRQATLCVSFTGARNAAATTRAWVAALGVTGDLESAGTDHVALGLPTGQRGLREGLAFMADVAYCASSFVAPQATQPEYPAIRLLSHLLSFDYLWEEVRVKGGAYGGMCHYQAGAGAFELMSYRDPNVKRTLDVYAQVREYVARKEWSDRDIERAMIGCAKNDSTPIRPGWATGAALWRHLGRLTEDLRRKRREDLLATTAKDVRNGALKMFDAEFAQRNTCVLSSRQRLEAANREMDEKLTIQDVVPPRTNPENATSHPE